jgi:hypothetical protein
MALVSEIDGGAATVSTTADCYAIGAADSLTGNYALAVSVSPGSDFVYIHNNTNTSAEQDSDTGKGGAVGTLTDFQERTSPNIYTNAGWTFTAETGYWKFISGYDYPVLSWQDETEPPADPAEFLEEPSEPSTPQ